MTKLILVLIFAELIMTSCAGDEKQVDVEKVINDVEKAPVFQGIDDTGKQWSSSDFVGKEYLVVYFYPVAMTGGCTKQACAFRDHKEALKEVNASVVGISGDDVQNLKYFKEANNLNFTLLSDSDGKIAKAFGVPTKDGGSIVRKIDGKEVTLSRNITTARWTFIIDKNGKIIYKNDQVNAAMDSQQVIDFLKKHKENEA